MNSILKMQNKKIEIREKKTKHLSMKIRNAIK